MYEKNYNRKRMYNKLDDFNSETISNSISDRSNSHSPHLQPAAPSFHQDYVHLQTLAEGDDDFKRVVDKWEPILHRAAKYEKIDEAIGALRQAHRTYVETQKILAMVYAEAGDFESAEQHIQNAHIRASFQIGHREVKLKPDITLKETRKIIDVAVSRQNPEHLVERLKQSAESGDIDETEKYSGLVVKCLEQRGLIERPRRYRLNDEEHITEGEKVTQFFRLQRALRDYYLKAYSAAIRRQLVEAMDDALNNEWGPQLGIRERQRKLADLVLDRVKAFVPDNQMAEAYDRELKLLSDVFHPIFDILIDCADDKEHLLRQISEPVKDDKGNVVGFKRKSKSTAIVPISFYREMFDLTGMPVFVPKSQETIFRRYHGEMPA